MYLRLDITFQRSEILGKSLGVINTNFLFVITITPSCVKMKRQGSVIWTWLPSIKKNGNEGWLEVCHVDNESDDTVT